MPRRKIYERLLYEAHGSTHLGANATEEMLDQRIWFPHFRSYVVSFVNSCAVCAIKRPGNKMIRKPPSVVMFEESPLDRVQADLIKINENHKDPDSHYVYILTAVDHHSKKAWAKCLKNKNAESVANILGKLFDKIFAQRGTYPKLLHTDNGGEFRNEILKGITTSKGIKQIHGAPYHSQSQGLIERFNRSVQDLLTSYKNNLVSSAWIKYHDD